MLSVLAIDDDICEPAAPLNPVSPSRRSGVVSVTADAGNDATMVICSFGPRPVAEKVAVGPALAGQGSAERSAPLKHKASVTAAGPCTVALTESKGMSKPPPVTFQ